MRNVCLITFKKIQKQPPQVFCKRAVLRNFAIFAGQAGKHLHWNLFFYPEYWETFMSTYFEELRKTEKNFHETEKN